MITDVYMAMTNTMEMYKKKRDIGIVDLDNQIPSLIPKE